uniref:Uncharacterized protein LOC108949641 n=1 Tax=Phallusia mammillata TaxID=59560 RepID=A0A6F9DJE4_9ASCI|nr:uncharacterized protein LOC108949641 [Phallusia mammillata]
MFSAVLLTVLVLGSARLSTGDCGTFVPPPTLSGGPVSTSYSDGTNPGSVLTFSCDTFWKLEGATDALCGSGSWVLSDPEAPECVKIECVPIVAPTNGLVSCTVGSTAGSLCSFTCNSGFTRVGADSAFCMNDGKWTDSAPVCEGPCGNFVPVPFEGIIVTMSYSDGTNSGSVVTFSCNVLWKFEGAKDALCTGGTWVLSGPEQPKCKKEASSDVDACVAFNTLDSGTVSCTDGSNKDSKCSFSCNPNFMLIGSNVAACLSGGNWNSSIPVCEESLCFPPLALIYESAASCNDTNKLNSLCTIDCPESDKREVQICLESGGGNGEGMWKVVSEPCPGESGGPVNPACDKAFLDILILMHGSLPTLEHQRLKSVVSVLVNRLFPLAISDHIWIRLAETNSSICKKSSDIVGKPSTGFNLTGLGKFFKEIIQVAQCASHTHFVKIAYDFLSYTSRPVAKEALVYILVGDPSPDTLDEALKLIEKGATISMLTLDSNTTHNIHPKFQHYTAHLEHEPVVQMMAMNLQTSQCPGPRCDVDKVQIEHGRPVCSFIPSVGSVCEVYCEAGYRVNGSTVLECVQIGDDVFEWNSDTPTCKEQVCVHVHATGDLSVYCSDGNQFLSECTFSCPAGSFLVGPQLISCIENAERQLLWSDLPPSCEKDLLCQPPLVEPSHSNMSCPNGNHFNAICTVTCNAGYALSGHKTIECDTPNSDGSASRSASIPSCKACVDCKKDILVVVDISGSKSKDEFKTNLAVVLQVFEQYVGAIEEGDVNVGIIQIGGHPSVVCDAGDVADVFQVELDLANYPMSQILFIVDNMEQAGGCPATGQAFGHTVSYMDSTARSETSRLMVLVTNTDAFTNSEQVSGFSERTGIELNVLNLGSSYQKSLKIIGRSESKEIDKTEVTKSVLVPEVPAQGSVNYANLIFIHLHLIVAIEVHEIWV